MWFNVVFLLNFLLLVHQGNCEIVGETMWALLGRTMNVFGPEECPAHLHITSQNETVLWFASESSHEQQIYEMLSDPMCLTEDKIPAYRTCSSNNGLSPREPPDCATTQNLLVKLSPCPEPFVKVESSSSAYICVLVSSAKKWENDCIQWGTQESLLHLNERDFRAVRQYLEQRNEEKFWLPLRSYGRFLPFLWHLPGSDSFGYVFDEDKYSKWQANGERYVDGNCLALGKDGNFQRIHVENCSLEYPSVCIYREKDPFLKLACPADSVTTRYRGEQNQCLEV